MSLFASLLFFFPFLSLPLSHICYDPLRQSVRSSTPSPSSSHHLSSAQLQQQQQEPLRKQQQQQHKRRRTRRPFLLNYFKLYYITFRYVTYRDVFADSLTLNNFNLPPPPPSPPLPPSPLTSIGFYLYFIAPLAACAAATIDSLLLVRVVFAVCSYRSRNGMGWNREEESRLYTNKERERISRRRRRRPLQSIKCWSEFLFRRGGEEEEEDDAFLLL